MAARRFLLIPGRTSKQGQQINIGKDEAAYLEMTTTLTIHADDLTECGWVAGTRVKVRSESGEAELTVKPGNIPRGMLFVPYGPPTCLLMPTDSDGTGMPTSKGWDVEVEAVSAS